MLNARTKVGVTGEGLPCTVAFYYAPDAPEDASPEKVTGLYQTRDGSSAFEIVRDGERYRDSDSGTTATHAHELIPFVVCCGIW